MVAVNGWQPPVATNNEMQERWHAGIRFNVVGWEGDT